MALSLGPALTGHRSFVSTGLVAVVALLLASASGCAGCGPKVEYLSQGEGPANALPLWPLGEGARPAQYLPAFEVPPLDQFSVHSQRVVEDGVEHRFDRGFEAFPTGMAVKQTENGDIYLTAAHYGAVDPPLLLVPAVVRQGMSWRAHRRLEAGDVLWGPDFQAPVDLEDDTWVFTVEQRAELEHGIFWRIVWEGPLFPHVKDAYGNGTSLRLRGFIELIEGKGPDRAALRVHSLDTIAPSNPLVDAEAARPFRDPGTSPALPVAASRPQAAPSLAMRALSAPASAQKPLFLRYARSSLEATGELVIGGLAVGTSSLLDPTGGSQQLALPTLTVSCVNVDANGAFTDFPRACPGAFEAPLFIRPDGVRVDRTSAYARTLAGTAQTSDPNKFPRGFEASAPFVADGNLFAFGFYVENGEYQPNLVLRAFGNNPAPVLHYTVQNDPRSSADGSDVFGLTQGLPFMRPQRFVGDLFTRRFDDGSFAVVGVRSRQTSVSSEDFAYHRGEPFSEVVWIGPRGHVLRRMDLQPGRLAVTHQDGVSELIEVGQLGELRRLHVERDGLWAELLGRVELPPQHVAGGAVEVAPGRFLVMTQVAKELATVGVTLETDNAIGMVQRPSTGANAFFLVDAPPTGLVDRDFAIRHLDVRVGVGVLRVCVPHRSGLVVDGVRVGDVEVSDGEIRRLAAGCLEVPLSLDAMTPSWLSLAVHLAGEGWVVRSRPVTTNTVPVGTQATLDDGSVVTPAATFDRFAVEQRPRAAQVDGEGVRSLQGALINSLTASRIVVDRRGAGLWALAQTYEPARQAPTLLDGTGNHAFPGDLVFDRAAPGGGLMNLTGHHLDKNGVVTAIPGQAAKLRRLDDAYEYSLESEVVLPFVDGTVCAAVTDPGNRVLRRLGCVDDAGLRLFDLVLSTLPPLDSWIAQEPNQLVIPVTKDGVFEVIRIDVPTGRVRRDVIGAGMVTPALGSDGTQWFVVSSPASRLVGVKDGVLESHALGPSELGLLAATSTELHWSTGLVTPRVRTGAGCVSRDEVCDGFDDDCDGEIDEGGAALCVQANGASQCVAAVCTVQLCAAGFANCNGTVDDGCETSTGTTSNCLGCGDACLPGAACTPTGCARPPLPVLVGGSDFVCGSDPLGVYCLGGPYFANSITQQWTVPVRLAAGARHVCALEGRAVSCLGRSTPALGAGVFIFGTLASPVQVPGLVDEQALFAGGNSTCVRNASGAVRCFGGILRGLVNVDGLDDQAAFDVLKIATLVPAFQDAVEVVLSGDRGCALFASGTVRCGGPVTSNGVTTWVDQPLSLTGVTKLVAATGASTSSAFAFVTPAGVMGLGRLGAITSLGGPQPAVEYAAPVLLTQLTGVRDVILGDGHVCVLTATDVRCSGASNAGQLGTAASAMSFASFAVTPGDFASGAATATSTCVVNQAGDVLCTGAVLGVFGGAPQPFRVVDGRP